MFNTIKSIFGLGTPVDYKALKESGALILDVRTPAEFHGGHIKGSKNVPLDQIEKKLESFKDKKQTIITCCASGMRSASAKNILKSKGFENVYNGGGWQSLQRKV